MRSQGSRTVRCLIGTKARVAWIATDSDRHHLLVRRNLTDPTDMALCPGLLSCPFYRASPFTP